MKHLTYMFFSFVVIVFSNLNAQTKKTYKIHTIAFYNLENLFDTINDPTKYDEASPIMELKANRTNAFSKKIQNMSRVIADIGFDVTNNTPAIIGVSEVENREVLETLVNDSTLRHKNYGIVHYDSPDIRGIDVGLLYQKKIFKPLYTSKHELKIYDNNGKRIYTRDQLLVSGLLENDMIHIIVNHWPSRRGGEENSRSKRVAAAKLSKHIVDSLQSNNPYAKIFIMGDLNDDPINTSVKDILKAKKNKNRIDLREFFNPFENFYKDGIGTTAYRDAWSLFDQIIISKSLLEKDYSSFQFYKAGVFNKNYLITTTGPYKGYPFRSWTYGGFSGGYSDHFPVYTYVIKEVEKFNDK
ncbi:endonuclease [Pseudalgibacter alginicilyticus]|uniref:Endonuclease n=1 Tax=Pseudalgibacter alginicilyticus TaxID=1736674 RepID=A0A0P0DBU1_9FLAO|nr:endonuclease [Pseudalgibacter alginicilyticus]ALJ05434.1 endonuclease [Pseudalgibacter alginicilyticus]